MLLPELKWVMIHSSTELCWNNLNPLRDGTCTGFISRRGSIEYIKYERKNTMKSKSAIGIIGGMGPEASAYLYQTLIQTAVDEFGAKQNHEFPEILLYSIPVPDFISDTLQQGRAYEILRDRVKQCNALDMSSLSIACNTAHVLFDELQQVSNKKFISMIDEVVKNVVEKQLNNIGIIGSPVTIASGLYQSSFSRFAIKTVLPTIQELDTIDTIIRRVIAKNVSQTDRRKLIDIAGSLYQRGAKGIVLGCTELPIIFPTAFSVPVFNCVEILAKTLLHTYYG